MNEHSMINVDAEQEPDVPADDGEVTAYFIAEAVMEKKALDPVIIDVRGKASYADYLVVCTGRNDRHVLAIADGVEDAMKPYRNRMGREGLNSGQWVLLDYDDVILHIFYAPVRRLYDLERLWDDVPRIDIDVPNELRGNDAIYQGYVVE